MVLGEDDFADGIELIHQAAGAWGHETVPPAGAMIETPAAVFSAAGIVGQADFVSLGTNDLVQFVSPPIVTSPTSSTRSRSCFRAIEHTVRQCGEVGCPVSVCGEAAGHPWTASLRVGLGSTGSA